MNLVCINWRTYSFLPRCLISFWIAFSNREDNKWWLLPTILLLFKSIQARFVDWHIANLEIPDLSLFCPDPDAFWAHESTSWLAKETATLAWALRLALSAMSMALALSSAAAAFYCKFCLNLYKASSIGFCNFAPLWCIFSGKKKCEFMWIDVLVLLFVRNHSKI